VFDIDGTGNIQVSLLSHETLYLPFTYLRLQTMYGPGESKPIPVVRKRRGMKESPTQQDVNRSSRSKVFNDSKPQSDAKNEEDDEGEGEEPESVIDVRFISGSHGHVVAVLRVHIFPRPFSVTRNVMFYEPENTVMKRRIQLKGNRTIGMFPGDSEMISKYIHCVEVSNVSANSVIDNSRSGGNREDGSGGVGSQVLVEWAPSTSDATGRGQSSSGSLDLIIRYRCVSYPSVGIFYILLYNDPYQCSLYEVSEMKWFCVGAYTYTHNFIFL
jgi:hypothetical protein